MELKTLIILALLYAGLFVLLLAFSGSNFYTYASIDNRSVVVCQEEAVHEDQVYSQTEFAHMNFYKSCMDNILYTSPLSRK